MTLAGLLFWALVVHTTRVGLHGCRRCRRRRTDVGRAALLGPPQLPLDLEPLPRQMLLLMGTGREDALWREVINPSTATNLRNWTGLATAKRTLIRKTANQHEKAINEGMPPRKTRQLEGRRAMRAPLMNGTANATQIKRPNLTNPTPPRTNHGLPTPSGPA